MQADDFCDLVAHVVDGVKGGHGILEDHADLVAADVPHFVFALFENVLAVHVHLAAVNFAGRYRQEADDG